MRKTKIIVYCDRCGKVTETRYKLALSVVPDECDGDERGDDVAWISPEIFARDYCEECLDRLLYGPRTEAESAEPEKAVEAAEEAPESSEVFTAANDAEEPKAPEDGTDTWETLYHVIDNLRREKWAYGKIAETLTYKYDFAVTGDEVRRRYQAMTKARKAV